MVRIHDNRIVMTRGDTLKTKINIVDADGNEYVPVEGDVIRFALKKDYSDPSPILTKTIPNDTLILHLEPTYRSR